MLASNEDKTFAVFLSYNGEDREHVQNIAVYLADRALLNPWFDQWCLIPGEPWVRNLERGLEASLSCALFIGESGLGPWEEPEMEAALRQHVRDRGFRLIPVLLPNAPLDPKLPTFLAGHTWVDFRNGLDDDTSRWRLECGVRGVPPGSGRLRSIHPEPSAATSPDPIEVENIDIIPARKPANIFISYRHHEPDRSLAHTFAQVLKKAGHQVFIDTGLRWGSD